MTPHAPGDQLAYSINPAIHNKPATWDPRFASGWLSCEGALFDLRQHVEAGTAFIAAAMSSDHRTSAAFLHADLVVIDIDSGLTLEGFASHDLAPLAAYLYTTCSHDPAAGKHRFRVLFRLPRRIEDPDLYKAIVTILTRALGGDKSCTDPCRLFYGNANGSCPAWNPGALLPESLIDDARKELALSRTRYERARQDHDELSIQRAIYVLDQIIPPTNDGERDAFIKVTAAASSGGDALFPAWCDWATRGHHGSGKNARQASEKFFRGFHGRSSLATLFYLAGEIDPDWRSSLPEELKGSETPSFFQQTGVAGYDHEDFLGLDPFDDAPLLNPSQLATQSLFDPAAPWAKTAVIAKPEPPEQHPDLEDRDSGDLDDFDPDIDPDELSDMEMLDEGFEVAARHADTLGEPIKTRRNKVVKEDTIQAIKDRLLLLYPGLRLNAMSLRLEYGPAHQPRVIQDPSQLYAFISAGTGQVFQKTLVYDVAHIIGQQNLYHPVRAYLEHCASYAEPCGYFNTLASELLGVPTDDTQSPRFDNGDLVADVILKRFLIGAVARAVKPGCTHDWMPILIGSQNAGKSTFFHYLTPPSPDCDHNYPWVSTIQQSIAQLKEKPHIMHSGWFIIFDEVERYFKRQYTEELKNLISVSVDLSARKYENERNFSRGFVLCGATNSVDFLCDPTGNRRFLPIMVKGKVPSPKNPRVKIIDLDRLKQDRDAIWSAAYRAYLAGEPHTFSSYELNQIEDYLNGFQRDTPIETEVLRVLEINNSGIYRDESYVTLSDVFKWMDIPLERHSNMLQPITDVMKRHGWKMKRIRAMNRMFRVWMRPRS